jgi:hypothetical protein
MNLQLTDISTSLLDDGSPLYILTFAEQAEGRVVSTLRLVLDESPFYVLGDSYELSLEEIAE